MTGETRQGLRRGWIGVFVGVLLALPASAEPGGRCANRVATRQPFFGDLHVHTSYSQDASTQGTRTTPRDAYRFARGEPLGIQPHDAEGRPVRSVRIDRPLDFTAVTDHAEQLGEVHICRSPGLPGHGSWVCRLYRGWPRAAFFLMNSRTTYWEGRWGFCGEGGRDCLEAAGAVWQEIRAAAEEADEACHFTSFVGYEWTAGASGGTNLHRNVIFRGANVPALPPSFLEAPTALELWDQLDLGCRREDGCEVLTIPHNSNLSAGLMFETAALRGPDDRGRPIDRAEALRRQRMEPLVEVMQHKGDSECAFRPTRTDEACDFEKLPYDAFGGKYAPLLAREPAPINFVRGALLRGLEIGESTGANAFRFGLIASTDTHLGTPGLVSERDHPGHGGAGEPAGSDLPTGLPDDLEFGPGGLAVLWAEENTRDALFEAMLRREAYGTSGPRPVVRFFGGDLPPRWCERADAAEVGYARGVPMGGTLGPQPGGRAPRFAVSAHMDPGGEASPGTPLQRIQIVKGWLDEGGTHERVFDVAGGENGAGVDLATCAQRGPGHRELCSVWEDPDHDPARPAFYYARVLENPSCRWSQYACLARGVDCADPGSVPDPLAACCAPGHQPVLQERAWTSPIWFDPTAARAR